ncbi:MAG: Pycsar system effector family protein [Bacteroidota bacterium]
MTHQAAPNTTSYSPSNLILQAQQYTLNIYNRQHKTALVYHSYGQMNAIVAEVKHLAAQAKAKPQMTEVALLAAYFRPLGFLENYTQAVTPSLNFAQQFFQTQTYSGAQQVLNSIQNSFQKEVKTIVDALLADAMNKVCYTENYSEQSALHRLELELVQNEKYSKKEWQDRQLTHLLGIQFYTPYAKINYAPQLAQHIAKLKNRVEKNNSVDEKPPLVTPKLQPFERMELEKTARGAQTFFRANYRNHINLSAIADNKANIMISVNSILISVLITVLTWRNITQTQPEVLMPGVIFLVTALASLIFAVLSARPKITNLNEAQKEAVATKRNIAFFGNFVHLDLEQYEEMMDEVLRKDDLLYGNMSRDLYYLGKVLSKKYAYLSISYNVFMVGFSVSVALFLILLLTR